MSFFIGFCVGFAVCAVVVVLGFAAFLTILPP